MSLSVDLIGAEVLLPGAGLATAPLSIAGGKIVKASAGRAVDLRGFRVLPGIIDVHGDGFERHVAPRRGAMSDAGDGLIATDAEFAANGITTAVLAQFMSWEGGLRGAEFADKVFRALMKVRDQLATDVIPQLRFETHQLDDYASLPERLEDWGVSYVVFNDHLPHDRLSQGRKPPRLTGQALKAARNPDDHFALLMSMHERASEVPAALDDLCRRLNARGLRLGSHDDPDPETRAIWRARGVRVSEFPETLEAAQAARDGGDLVIMGAPNLVRGGSHKGNVEAAELVAQGLCDALASDYHYPSPRRAALKLIASGQADIADAWSLLSEGPAKVLGLTDRGRLEPGLRADLVVIDAETGQIGATISGGKVSYMTGEAAARFVAA